VKQCGDSIGVGLRQARYSAVGPASLPELRAVLRAAAERLGAPLRPLPISLFGPSDPRSLARLLHESDDEAVGGIELDSPAAVIRAVGRCRVVVTGSYHPAVFALAQGIPTIGLTRSLHYQCKLRGLAALFGHGCRVIHLGGPRSAELLARTIDEFWGHADGMRPDLLAAARRQLAAGDTAHRELRRIVGPAWLRFALGA